MLRRRNSVGLVVGILAALLTPLSAGAATTLFVSSGTCDDTTTDSSVTPYCTIQAAEDDAVGGDTIQIGPGTFTGSGLQVVFVNTSVSIDGAGQGVTIIDGQDARQGIVVNGADVVISDLTITQGSGSNGGNLYTEIAGSDLDLTDVTLQDGTSPQGGGIYIGANTTADLLRVTVSANAGTTAIGAGGGGAVRVNAGAVVTITDSTFDLNTAVAHGGAIGTNAASTITIVDSAFTNNSALGAGGAIWGHAPGLSLTISGTTFSGNDAGWDGGAVEIEHGTFRIDYSLFSGNTAALQGGGLSYIGSAGTLLVTNTTFFDNDATDRGGGALAGGRFVNTTFAGNSSGDDGGGLAASNYAAVSAANSIFAGNTAVDVGPDCYVVRSEGHNLAQNGAGCFEVSSDLTGNVIGVDPFLLPLADNGGPTLTMALPLGSSARNAGNPDPFDPTDWDAVDDQTDGDWSCAGNDQRQVARTDARCDLGAYEFDRVVRYSGADRYETAAAISAAHFPGGAPTVFVATGANFPDALAGAAWANIANKPLLLVNASGVPAATAAELTRLNPSLIVIIGGTGAIPDAVKTTLEGFATTNRIFGADRYATAIAISQQAFPDGTAQAVLIATGLNFPDALAAGATADNLNAPLLLVPGNQSDLPPAVADEIIRLGADTIVVVGGTGAVSTGIFDDLDVLQGGDTTTRIFGADRYATAIAISQYAFSGGADLAYLATGVNFPDALAGAAAALDAPILLVPGTDASVPANVETELVALGAAADGSAIILGGTGVVSLAIETDLDTIFAS